MSSNSGLIVKYSRRAAVIAVCFVMLFAQTGCLSALIEIMEESDAEELVTDFIDAFLEDPAGCKYTKYCAEDPEFELTDEQSDIFFELTSDVKSKVKKTTVNSSGSKADVYVQLSGVVDLNELETLSGTEEDLLEAAEEIDQDTYEVRFSLKKNKKDDWVIADMEDFEDLLMNPYANLKINDGTEPDPTDPITVTPNIGSDVASDPDLVMNAYVYSVWYDVEMDFPLTTETIPSEKAYAITNVFYFSTPINGTFNAVLLGSDGKAVMSDDFHVNNEVTVSCDFSAGMAGWVNFNPGNYYVELYYDGNLVATSEEVTIE
ncbi:MAG: hypothetical protein IK128_05890 [Clostridiales bacterium]|nr:hypothetical protein [Clostridiales bacterium]